MMSGMAFTKTYRKAVYPTISALRPEESQAGKTVLVTGGHTGIGNGIARAFAEASAARVIIVGRRADLVTRAVEKLATDFEQSRPDTVFDARPGDMASEADNERLWGDLKSQGIVVDVLILAAAVPSPPGNILGYGREVLWSIYVSNVRSTIDMAERLWKQDMQGAAGKQKYLVNLSSNAAHDFLYPGAALAGYGATKNAAALVVQQIAKDIGPEELQAINVHPGCILSETVREMGFNEDSPMPWDNANLPANFAVWAATPEARFLHGRFVWANWDVDELRSGEIGKRIREDPSFLKIGVHGL